MHPKVSATAVIIQFKAGVHTLSKYNKTKPVRYLEAYLCHTIHCIIATVCANIEGATIAAEQEIRGKIVLAHGK